MKINIKQEGGFIGMASKAKLDFDKLTDDEQKMLNEIVDKAAEEAKKIADDALKAAEKVADDTLKAAEKVADDMLKTAEKVADDTLKTAEKVERDLPPSVSAKSGPAAYGMTAARDTFSYSLSMKRDGKKIDVVFDDTNAPSGLVELFQKHIEP